MCIRQELYAIILLFILYWTFIKNNLKAITIKVPIEKMENISIFDFNL